MAEVEEQVKRIQQHPGVQGVIVINDEGIAIKTTLDNSTTVQCANLLTKLSKQARDLVREGDPTNDLSFLRIRTKKNEIMLAPNQDYMMVVIQNIGA